MFEQLLEDTITGLDEIERGPAERVVADMLLLALEREQVVTVSYSDDYVSERIESLDVDDDVRELVRRVVLWTHRDEALHSQYVRGHLLQSGLALPRLSILGRQFVGSVGGWCSALSNRRDEEHLGLRRIAALSFLTAGRLVGRVPETLVSALRVDGFEHFCALNAALEQSAIVSYERLLPLLPVEQHDIFERILADERRHAAVFSEMAASFDGNRLTCGHDDLRRRIGAISPWFLPGADRPDLRSERHARSGFGSGRDVFVERGGDAATVTQRVLRRSGFDDLVRNAVDAAHADRSGDITVAIRTHFMYGYDRCDRSNIVSPEVVEAVARRALELGARDVVVLETPTVYDRFFAQRSVAEVAEYFGFVSEHYRVVDVTTDVRSVDFERGLAAGAVSSTWLDASVRIVVSKLRTDPDDVAHLSLATLAGIGGRVDEEVHTDRLIDHRTTALMALDVAPPDFALVDAHGDVADGPLGVMGCRTPSRQDRVYGGVDALSVDAAVLADMGFTDPFASPFFKQADQWFGASSRAESVVGDGGPLPGFRAPQSSVWFRAVAATAAPIYFHLSRRGELFVPQMDTDAFPEIRRPSRAVRIVRATMQRVFGLRAPSGDAS